MTVWEVAAVLGVATSTVYQLCAKLKLPHLRVSNAIRITPDGLADYIKSTQE